MISASIMDKCQLHDFGCRLCGSENFKLRTIEHRLSSFSSVTETIPLCDSCFERYPRQARVIEEVSDGRANN